jgi:hypothetical protein
MKVLNARVNWMQTYANDPHLELLVDSIPSVYPGQDWHLKPHSDGIFCWTEEGGYVSFFTHDPRNQRGYGGAIFRIRVASGALYSFPGPWSSNAMFASEMIGQPVVSVYLTEEGGPWYAAGSSGHVLLPLAQQAAAFAGVELLPVKWCDIVHHGTDDRILWLPKAPGKLGKWEVAPGEPTSLWMPTCA